MAKIQSDKYYTPPDLAKYVVDKTREIIGIENITEYIEPSAGTGVFLDYLDKPYIAYDIEPEDSRIIKQDFLTADIDYKEGRCIIGNPPFGNSKNDLFNKFYKKSIHICDYISFILPISQYKNDINLFEFSLLYSEDLGERLYTDRNLWCCLNIYKKPIHRFNQKPNYNLKDVTIKRHTRNNNEIYKLDFNYDIRICCRGANIGKVCQRENQYAKEYVIKINNVKYKNKIVDTLINADWNKLYPSISTPYLAQWQVYKYLKEQIPELQ